MRVKRYGPRVVGQAKSKVSLGSNSLQTFSTFQTRSANPAAIGGVVCTPY